MQNISMAKNKLNIFQKLQLKLFINRKKISKYDFDNAPDFIKNSQEVISRIIDGYVSGQEMFDVGDERIKTNYFLECINKISNEYNFTFVLLNKDNSIFDILPDKVIIKFLVAYPQGRKIFVKDKDLKDDYLLKFKLNDYALEVIERVLNDENKDINDYSNFILDLFDNKFSDFISKYYSLVKDNKEINGRIIFEIVTKKDVKLLSVLETEKREKLFMENPSVLQIENPEGQLNFIRKNTSFVKYALFSVQDIFVEENPQKNFAFTDFDYQMKKILANLEYYNYTTPDFRKKLFTENLGLGEEEFTNSKKEIQCEILEKILTIHPEKIEELEGWKLFYNIKHNIPKNAENLTIEQSKNLFLHTKYKSAPCRVFFGMLGKPGGGVVNDRRSYASNRDIAKLSNEALVELLKIDSNYVLIIDHDYHDDSHENKKKYIEVFKEMYKDNPNIMQNFDKYKEIIQELISNRSTAFYSYSDGESVERLQKYGRVEELKILFNPLIMNSNSFEDISKYYDVTLNNYRIMDTVVGDIDYYSEILEKLQDTRQYFINIIKNTYGESAIEILKNRPNLNVHTLNSLEIFDSRIMQNFSKEVINDFITYDFEGFSTFLDIVKNPLRLEKFKQYYEILSSIIGQDAKTMQKAIFEFGKVEEIIDNNIILSIISKTNDNNKDKAKNGLKLENNYLFALVSGNKCEAKNIEDLEKYEVLLNEKLKSGKLNKEEACINLFGINLHELELMSKLYGVSGNLITEEEQNLKEKMSNYIIKFLEAKDVNEFIQKNGIYRNPILLFSTLRKIKKNQAQIMNSTFLTKEKMDKAIEEDMINNPNTPITERPIYKTTDNAGNEIYHLNGYNFSFLSCQTDVSISLSDADFLHSEHPGGNSAICTRYVNTELAPEKHIYQDWGKYHYFTHLDANQIIASSCADAGTSHDAKKIKMSGNIRAAITELKRIANESLNEVSFYRVITQHEDRTRDAEGRIIPQFTSYPPSEELKKMGVHQLIIHSEKYRNRRKTLGNVEKAL